MTIENDKQKLSPGTLLEMYDLDLGIFQVGLVYRFWSGGTTAITWQGNTYTPLPIIADGFEKSGRGTLPTPTLKISNVGSLISVLVKEFGDPIGATLRRHRTFDVYLDGASQADPNQHFPVEVWLVERKKNENKVFVEFELSASIDQEGKQLPGRQVLQSACTLRYRLFDATNNVFDYTKATCPWTGGDSALGPVSGQGGTETPYFTENRVSTGNPALDRCGKTLADCKCRFAAIGMALPFGGFPSVGRIR